MKQSLGQDQWSKSVVMWEKIIKSIKTGDQALATHALLGSLDLIGLESFVAGKGSTLSKDERQFNEAFDRYCQYVAEMLWRVNTEFSSYDVAGMFMVHSHARSIVSALLSSNNGTCQAAVEIIKTISVEDGRREALHYILEKAYESILFALSDVIRRIASKKPFAPMPALLKLSMDVVDSLCDSEDGILRSKMLSDNENKATQSYWESVWDALNVIFKTTETWSYKGYDKTEMQDFCRDTMEFADKFFNNYDVYVNALALIDQVTGIADSSKVANQLLQHPKDTMDSMVVWLRLRDEYLASKIVDLVSKLLVKLRNVNLEIKESTREYIEDVITGNIKAKLSPQQIAELRRALETHTGQRLALLDHPHQSVKVGKQGSLNSWITSDSKKGMVLVDPRKTQPLQRKIHESDSSDSMKDVIKQSTKAAQTYKERMAGRVQPAPIVKVKEPPKALLDADSIKRRKAEAEARKRADLNRARVLRGLPPLPDPSDVNAAKDKANIPKGTGVMVSSDDESDDSCDQLDRELFGITKPTKTDAAKATSKGPIEFIDEAPTRKAPVKIQRIVRSAKDMRARLAPDLTALHKEILHWDYFDEGEFPPASSPDQYKAVPNKFRNTVEYKNIFRPLLTLEAWQGFVKAREEITSKPYLTKVLTRTSVDAFTEIGTTMTHAESVEQPLSEGDIILFSKSSNPVQDSSSPHCLARVWRVTRKRHHLDVVYRAMPLNPLMRIAGPDSSMYGVKIHSITPLEREYGALQGLEYYDLCDYILNARPSNLLSYGDGQIDSIRSTYDLNTAQAMAVKSALDNDAFTLIQGPPGSGKTKTIVAIVGAIISPAFRYEGEQIGDPKGQTTYRRSKKMLVCAPSNAAVDELVMRFKKGIKTMRGTHYDINVVRVGRSDNINSQVRDVTLEELVNARLNGLASGNGTESKKVREVMKNHQDISQKLREAREQLNSGKAKDSQEDQDWRDAVKGLQKRKAELSAEVDKARDSERRMARDLDLQRKRVQQMVLDQSHVVCATLSGSGHEMFQNLNIEFETVIVDEAAQCVEMSALIPLKYGCSKCILVGDPKQLPPTVFSREAARFQYEQSLFVRMQTNHPDTVHLLDTQYRMHPEISIFPSNTFYDGRLRDGTDMQSLRQQPWHANELLGPYRFFDVSGQHQSDIKGHSLINRAEIDIAIALVRRLLNDFHEINFKGKIGIITPYKSQLRELKRSFIDKYGNSITDFIEFNTTDAFQGRESEIIIFSCVRAQTSGSVGFLADIRRMNVGLTRAKSSLWVLGNSETLMRGEFWRKLIEDSKKRGRFWDASRYMGLLMEPSNAKEHKLKTMELKPAQVLETDMSKAPTANMVRVASMSPASDDPNSGRISLPASLSNSRAPSVSMSDAPSLHSRANTNSPANITETKSNNSSRQSSAEVKDVEMKDAPSDDKNIPKVRVVQPPKNFNPLGGNTLSKPTQNPVMRKRPLDNNPLLVRKKQKKT
jgi:senataxin